MYFLILPKIQNNIYDLEKKSGRIMLSKATAIVNNAIAELKLYEEDATQNIKDEIKNVVQATLSIVDATYKQSLPENIGQILQSESQEFEHHIQQFYDQNKNSMSEQKLKEMILNYTKLYRYNISKGHFFILDNTRFLMNPENLSQNGKDVALLQDANNSYVIQEYVKLANDQSRGIIKYQWKNPKTDQVEDKLSYVFVFKPFNWIIGTSEFITELEQQLKDEVLSIVSKTKFSDKANYLFVADMDLNILSHPALKNVNLTNAKDVKGNYFARMIREEARKGEGYVTYWWKKLNSKDISEKISYVIHFDKWDWIIGTGVSKDEVGERLALRKAKLIEKLRKDLNSIKIGKTGYMYIFDGQGNLIVHQNKDLEGKNLNKVLNPSTNHSLLGDLKEAYANNNGTLRYKWDHPKDRKNFIYEKVSWIDYIPEYDWYVCSSAYLYELQESSTKIGKLILFLTFWMFLFLIIFLLSSLNAVLKPINSLSKDALEIRKGNLDVRNNIKRSDEVGILAEEFNYMVSSLQEHISTLDKKVKDRTQKLEEMNTKVTDSIKYAYNIQTSLLPNESIFEKNLKEFFTIWEPRDIVGGDIYFLEPVKNGFLIGVIDCTGHGVPGAFMTMLAKTSIKNIINENNCSDPASILEKLDMAIKDILYTKHNIDSSDDGLDMGLCYVEHNKLIFSGARIHLFVEEEGEVERIKADRLSIGYRDNKDKIFSNQEVSTLNRRFYMTTDGYIDQCGGEKNLPMGTTRFKNIITKQKKKILNEQKEDFMIFLSQYQAKNNQNDDITVIAFKVH
jgi:signal transduction histidine kinase